MLKKIYGVFTILLTILFLVACNGNTQNSEIELPTLSGYSKYDISVVLDELGVEYEFVEEYNLNVSKNTFIKYGNNLAAGMKINKDDVIIKIVIASHDLVLPDLTGKSEIEVQSELIKLGLRVDISYRKSTKHENNTFIEYGGTYKIGQVVDKGITIPVRISEYPNEYISPIFISKYVSGIGFDRAIEIFNSLDEEVLLEDYALSFYLDGASSETERFTLPKGTKLSAKDTLLIVHSSASQSLKNKADLLTDKLGFVGKDYIKLLDHKGSKIDEFGIYEKYVLEFNNRIMVRNEETIQSNTEFILGEWDIYHYTHHAILDSHPTIFPTSFTYHLEDSLLEGGFDTPRGMSLVEYVSANDGDTAAFTPGFTDETRVRFVGINTREMLDPDPKVRAQAQAAKSYLESLLVTASEIYIQHDPSSGPDETYNRALGFVWANGRLVNYLMVLNGHSENIYYDASEAFIYEGVTLNEWFRRAESSARALRLGIWA